MGGEPTVNVSDGLIRIDDKAFATASISSVEVRRSSTAMGCGSLFAVVAGLGVLGSIAFPPLFVIAGPMAFLAYILIKVARKNRFQLVLTMAGVEQMAFASPDLNTVERLRSTVEGAISAAALG
jgi:hypothetical protein